MISHGLSDLKKKMHSNKSTYVDFGNELNDM